MSSNAWSDAIDDEISSKSLVAIHYCNGIFTIDAIPGSRDPDIPISCHFRYLSEISLLLLKLFITAWIIVSIDVCILHVSCITYTSIDEAAEAAAAAAAAAE